MKEYLKNNKFKVILTAISILVIVFIILSAVFILPERVDALEYLKFSKYQASQTIDIEGVEAFNYFSSQLNKYTAIFILLLLTIVSSILLLCMFNLYVHLGYKMPTKEQLAKKLTYQKERKKAALQAKLDALNSEDKKE